MAKVEYTFNTVEFTGYSPHFDEAFELEVPTYTPIFHRDNDGMITLQSMVRE